MNQPVNKECSTHRCLIFEQPFLTIAKKCRNVVKYMCLVDLLEETFEFVQALLYQLTLAIKLSN